MPSKNKEILKAAKKRMRERRKASGLCTDCGENPAIGGKTRCQNCAERHKNKAHGRSGELAEAGRCKCGRTPSPGFRCCDYCLAAAKAGRDRLHAKRGDADCCRQCGKPSNGDWYCRSCKDRQAEWARADSLAARKIVFDHYGWRCACCCESESRFLTLDHKNGDGAKQRRAENGNGRNVNGGAVYRRIIKANFPDDLQVHCWNCNVAKQFNGGVCPHQLLPPDKLEALRSFNRSRTQITRVPAVV